VFFALFILDEEQSSLSSQSHVQPSLLSDQIKVVAPRPSPITSKSLNPSAGQQWTHETTLALIDICSTLEVEKLNVVGGKKDSKWNRVVGSLEKLGHNFTRQQVKNKWCQEKILYRRYIDQAKRTGMDE
jgi:hypothetical protein